MNIISNIAYTDSRDHRNCLDIYLPDGESFPVFVYFHGGGLTGGSKTADTFYTQLAKLGICVVTAEYRLYPEARFPDFLEDCADAVKWVYDNIESYGNSKGIYVGGSSAGGYITMMLCFDESYLAKRGIDADAVTGYVFDAGQTTSHFNVLKEKGQDSRRIVVDETAPLYFIRDGRNYPPMKIIVSDRDMRNRYEQTLLLMGTLAHFGYKDRVDYSYMENSDHCSYVSARKAPDGKNLFTHLVYDFISSVGGEKTK